ncbi:hypothetical protein [Alkalihalobacillus pseudalcaliphilus]|nr:hypothetical protein [Alkalihalobacillus pseudalcaliphilus]
MSNVQKTVNHGVGGGKRGRKPEQKLNHGVASKKRRRNPEKKRDLSV